MESTPLLIFNFKVVTVRTMSYLYYSDCCRSQALNLSIRPVYLGSNASPAAVKKVVSASTKPKPPSPPPPPPPKKKQVSFNKKPKTGVICVPQCQRLCKPVCMLVKHFGVSFSLCRNHCNPSSLLCTLLLT